MVSWVITGATRGIGNEFVKIVSADPNNQVFALIRSRATAGPLEELASTRKNVHIILTDVSDPKKLAQAAAEVSQVTGGSLDILLLNASSSGPETSALSPSAFHGREEDLENEIAENFKTNVISSIFTINAFLDLVRNGKEKRIVQISGSSADVEFTRITGFPFLVGYSASKAAMMVVMSKYSSELAQDGIKVLSMSPGWVDTDAAAAVTGDPEVRKYMLAMFQKIDPKVTGPNPRDVAVNNMLRTIQNFKQADSGKFLTHVGQDVFNEGPSNVDWF